MQLDKKAVSRTVGAAIIVGIILIGVAAYAAFTMFQQPATTKDVLKVAIGVDLDTVDPHGQTTTTCFNIMRHVYETLLWYDENGNLIPWLAESWEVSDDGLTYTFHLRKGVKFHDGTEFNAEAVRINVERWTDPTVKVPTRGQLGPIKEAIVVDDYTVKIVLEKPFAPFLRALASYLLIASPNVIEKFWNKSITEPVGTGPFKFASWEKGKVIVLERNDDYWGEKPKLKRVEWVIMPEAATREAALLAGDVDVAFQPPPSDIKKLEADARFKVYKPISNRILFVALLPRGPLANSLVRKALNYAIDRESLVENVLFGLAIPSPDSLVPPHFFGYAKMEPYEYDPDKAKQLLAEAGYPNGFKMVLLHPTGRYLQDKQVAEAIQAYLMEVGINVELKTMDWPSFVAALVKPVPPEEKEYDAVLVGWGPGVPDAHFTLHGQFHSGQIPPGGLALAYYNNSKVDQLLEAAMTEVDEAAREEFYKEAMTIIWGDAPWIPLYTQRFFVVASAKLEGVMVYVDGEQFFFHAAFFKP